MVSAWVGTFLVDLRAARRESNRGLEGGHGQQGRSPQPTQQHPCREEHPRGGGVSQETGREAQQSPDTPAPQPVEGKGTVPAAHGRPRGQGHPSRAASLSSSRGSSRRPHGKQQQGGLSASSHAGPLVRVGDIYIYEDKFAHFSRFDTGTPVWRARFFAILSSTKNPKMRCEWHTD